MFGFAERELSPSKHTHICRIRTLWQNNNLALLTHRKFHSSCYSLSLHPANWAANLSADQINHGPVDTTQKMSDENRIN